MKDQDKKSSWTYNLIAGTIAGTISTTVGHPFDQIKIMLQSG